MSFSDKLVAPVATASAKIRLECCLSVAFELQDTKMNGVLGQGGTKKTGLISRDGDDFAGHMDRGLICRMAYTPYLLGRARCLRCQ